MERGINSPFYLMQKILKKVIKCLELKAPIRYYGHNRLIRKVINGDSFKVLGYYTLEYHELIGQFHKVDYCIKAESPTYIIIHELIHAWQAENNYWKYGHKKDFKAMALYLSITLDLDYDKIITP